MFLNLDILADRLASRYRVSRYGPECRELTLRRPYPYFPGEAFLRDRLYVARTQSLPHTPPEFPVSMICIGASFPPGWIASGYQLLLVNDPVDPMRLLSQIQEIYDEFDHWDTAIRDEIEKYDEFDLKRIIEAGVSMLTNPICVSNQFLQFIFTSEIKQKPDGRVSVVVNDTPTPLPVAGLDNIKEFCRMERKIRNPYLTAAKVINPPEGHKTYCNNLYPMDHFAGCVYLKEIYHPFRASDYLLADYFFEHFQKAFVKYLYRARSFETPENMALSRLLDGAQLGPDERSLFRLNPGEHWTCFRLREQRGTHFMPKDYMYAILNTMMPGSIYAASHHQEIVGILRISPEDRAGENSSITLFRELLDRMEYIAGLSNEFTDIQEFCLYLPQAAYAVDQLAHGDKGETLTFFESKILQFMLSSCARDFPLETLYSRTFRILMEHDKEKGTDFLKTLNICLKHEMNMTKAADALYIHRTSLLKRIERIEKLAGSILDDPDERLYFRICFRLMELGEKDKTL